MAWGVSDFGQGFGLGSGFDGFDLGTIDTATPPLADNSNGSPQMQPFDWSSVSWIGGALDKALNFSLQKDQLDYARQNSQYQAQLAARQQYYGQYGQVGYAQPLSGRQIIVFAAIGLGVMMLMSKG